MLNPFPDLLVLTLLAPFILRIAVGIIFLKSGYTRVKKDYARITMTNTKSMWSLSIIPIIWFGVLEVLIGLSLVAGFLTQIGALAGILVSIFMLSGRGTPSLASQSQAFYIVVLAVCLSLMLSGAGAIAIDLPL